MGRTSSKWLASVATWLDRKLEQGFKGTCKLAYTIHTSISGLQFPDTSLVSCQYTLEMLKCHTKVESWFIPLPTAALPSPVLPTGVDRAAPWNVFLVLLFIYFFNWIYCGSSHMCRFKVTYFCEVQSDQCHGHSQWQFCVQVPSHWYNFHSTLNLSAWTSILLKISARVPRLTSNYSVSTSLSWARHAAYWVMCQCHDFLGKGWIQVGGCPPGELVSSALLHRGYVVAASCWGLEMKGPPIYRLLYLNTCHQLVVLFGLCRTFWRWSLLKKAHHVEWVLRSKTWLHFLFYLFCFPLCILTARLASPSHCCPFPAMTDSLL